MNQPTNIKSTANATLEAREVAPDAFRLAETMTVLTAAALRPDNIDGAWFAQVAPGYKLQEVTQAVEQAQQQPLRKRGTITVKSVDSLLAVLKDQDAAQRAYVFADPDARTIVAVLNDQRELARPGWRDHRAHYHAEYTPEFSCWLSNGGASKAKRQTEFAEFLEDNLADIQEPFAQQLLEVATTIQATTGIEFKSAKRLQDGQTQLTYNETIEARAGAAGGLTIPREFTLGLRIFKNGAGYKLKARLKYRLAGNGVTFWYEPDRWERAVEDAFAEYVARVKAESGYQVLIGRAD